MGERKVEATVVTFTSFISGLCKADSLDEALEMFDEMGVASSEIATCAFTWGTVAVLPFYTLMVVVPNTQLTKRVMKSSTPYVLLGIPYAYLVYLSWTPDTLHTLFASKHWLPELPGITKLFSSEMTMASAWIHYMVVDLFAARQIFHDGFRNKVGTWHSICLCLLCCPVGIISHATTKALIRKLK